MAHEDSRVPKAGLGARAAQQGTASTQNLPLAPTCGQLPRQGRHLSWNKFWRDVFCSLAIILCSALFSSPSRSEICTKQVGASVPSSYSQVTLFFPTVLENVKEETRNMATYLQPAEGLCCLLFRYLALGTALFVIWELRGLWEILLELLPGFLRHHPPLVLGYAQVTCRETGRRRALPHRAQRPNQIEEISGYQRGGRHSCQQKEPN